MELICRLQLAGRPSGVDRLGLVERLGHRALSTRSEEPVVGPRQFATQCVDELGRLRRNALMLRRLELVETLAEVRL